ncbi:hypothetical protein GJ496_010186 [Pomphorhynchus laevis]|nr:hypothetical protein GJ496_010186 [Pomphorhynchus laevis]
MVTSQLVRFLSMVYLQNGHFTASSIPVYGLFTKLSLHNEFDSFYGLFTNWVKPREHTPTQNLAIDLLSICPIPEIAISKHKFLHEKTTTLKNILKSRDLEFMMEAHNGISAKIVEETGFKSIWASGLCIAAQWGVRDANEASWTQVLEMIDFMSDNTTIPILVDVDTGYGNFNNARRLIKKLEQNGAAGACVEDKFFPKKNSFVNGREQPLADIEEFCLKLQKPHHFVKLLNFRHYHEIQLMLF